MMMLRIDGTPVTQVGGVWGRSTILPDRRQAAKADGGVAMVGLRNARLHGDWRGKGALRSRGL